MDLLFDVIKIALGTKSELPYSPSAIEWNQLFNLAAKQTSSNRSLFCWNTKVVQRRK